MKTCLLITAVLLAPLAAVHAQDHIPAKADIPFNRYYELEEVYDAMRDIARAYPDIVTLEQIGESRQGRPLLVATVHNPRTGPDSDKPAMWIDGSVHANEIQATEVVLYSLWYLVKAYGHNEQLTELVDETVFHFHPVVNPDSRVAWFSEPTNANYYRANLRPVDNDRDGRVDEDPFDDLDGDGSITNMWRKDPNGRWIRSRQDPRIFERVAPGEKGEWTYLGSEGIDNDGDGRINEDGPGGDDMNRNWPGGWKPDFVQRGAGEFALSNPETRPIGDFIIDHPNIAAVQSYHNTGGMILRGPGVSTRNELYPRSDQRVYDAIADVGVEMLPYYRSLVIYKDLYTVHGGFVTWTAETLGIISFTNELWTTEKYFQRDVRRPNTEQQWIWRDHIAFGQVFKDYTEHDHPTYGKILVGGPNKWASRSTPTFMLEEECHRNFAFTMLHAREMPRLSFENIETSELSAELWQVTFEVANERQIPTRTAQARNKAIGQPDLLKATGGTIVASGRVDGRFDTTIDEPAAEPARMLVDDGIPGQGRRMFRLIVEAPSGTELTLRYEAEKARDIETTVELQ
jgi:hypothetical protein